MAKKKYKLELNAEYVTSSTEITGKGPAKTASKIKVRKNIEAISAALDAIAKRIGKSAVKTGFSKTELTNPVTIEFELDKKDEQGLHDFIEETFSFLVGNYTLTPESGASGGSNEGGDAPDTTEPTDTGLVKFELGKSYFTFEQKTVDKTLKAFFEQVSEHRTHALCFTSKRIQELAEIPEMEEISDRSKFIFIAEGRETADEQETCGSLTGCQDQIEAYLDANEDGNIIIFIEIAKLMKIHENNTLTAFSYIKEYIDNYVKQNYNNTKVAMVFSIVEDAHNYKNTRQLIQKLHDEGILKEGELIKFI